MKVINRRRRRGNVMVELALGSTLMVPLLAGTFQFGYAMYVYNSLQNAVRAGARYASVRPYSAAGSAAYVDEVKNIVVYGTPVLSTVQGGGANGNGNGNNGGTANIDAPPPVVRGLATSNVSVSLTMNGSVPGMVTVSITGFSVDAIFKTFTFDKPAATFTYNGA